MEPTTELYRSDARIIDELMDVYLAWREACMEVWAAYEHWNAALASDRALAAVAYGAALDREHCAAECYRLRAADALALWDVPEGLASDPRSVASTEHTASAA